MKRLLIANRGEIAIRIARACEESNITAVAIYSQDDGDSLHRVRADEAIGLPGRGARAYLDQDAIVSAAITANCDAIHPGYGFLSESADFARACREAGLIFVGPDTDVLALFGDKAAALEQARSCDIPTLDGTAGPTSLTEALEFISRSGGGVMIKAIAGGGGRGMRAVEDAGELAEAWELCSSEALATFGNGAVYVERLVTSARHIEVQIVGDGRTVTHLFDRECTVQRRHQKLVEIAPSPWLSETLRTELLEAAVRLGTSVGYSGVGTVEFLVETDDDGAFTGRYFFIELNPRIQVEHTVTEEVTGIDIVQTQLRIAAGESLADFNWSAPADRNPRGCAIQLRVNLETFDAGGGIVASAGVLKAFDVPSGPDIRVDTLGYQGLAVGVAFDSLLAKVIVSAESFQAAARRAYRALGEFRISGVATNLTFLQSVLQHREFREGRVDTRFVERHMTELASATGMHRQYYPELTEPSAGGLEARDEPYAQGEAIVSPMRGQVSAVTVKVGELFVPGQVVAVVEAMKMEHVIYAEQAGMVTAMLCPAGTLVEQSRPILIFDVIEETQATAAASDQMRESGAMAAAMDIISVEQAKLLDAARPAAVALAAKRRAMTARERITLLTDPLSFSEIGGLARNETDGGNTPADGVVIGRALIEGRPVFVISQDFSVLGGSAGHLGMRKMERIASLAHRHGMPLIMLLDGGGHRIQDGQNSRDYAVGAPLFQQLVDLSGWVPVVAAVLGAGFAANTNFAGCADFVVMVRDKALMGLAGPALVKAGTGETVSAEELGGADAQVDRHGLAHLGVKTEEEALGAIRQYLGFLPSNSGKPAPAAPFAADSEPSGEALAELVPVNTRQSYDMREVVSHIVDRETFFEISPTYAPNLLVGFGRLAGAPVGVIANQPMVRAGMLDAPACEKGAHFIGVCDAFGIPLVYLIDVPGFSIGSEAERSVLGRRSARMIFEIGISTVPRVSVVLRKGYGLGYIAMCGGRSFDADLALGWPTAEICAMSVEGSVDVAYRKVYENAADPEVARRDLIDGIRSQISPLHAAEGFGLDDIVHPADTRARIIEALSTAPTRRNRRSRFERRISPI